MNDLISDNPNVQNVRNGRLNQRREIGGDRIEAIIFKIGGVRVRRALECEVAD